MRAYNGRPDLQAVFPQAANLGNTDGLICWAQDFGVNEFPSLLGPHTSVYQAICPT